MSVAWGALATRLAKVERRAQAVAAEAAGPPDGMMGVLLFGIGVLLGGYPTPAVPENVLDKDDVFAAVDRALGYPDPAERRNAAHAAGESPFDEAWLLRFTEAAERLSERIGAGDFPHRTSEASLVAFARMLNGIALAHPEWGSPSDWPCRHPWSGLDRDMDAWIRSAGLSPETIRAKALAEPLAA